MTLEMMNEVRRVCKWMEGEIGYACEDYLWDVAKEADEEARQMEDYAGEPAYPTNEEKFEHVQEIVWGEAEHYVDFVKKEGH